MRTKLPEQIVLKVNRASWTVSLKKDKDDIVLQGSGWEEFVNAYTLKKADILVFKYDRRECFEVWLFDRASSCEKEASYFLRKDQQKNPDDDDEVLVFSAETENMSKGFTDDTNQGDRNRRRKKSGSTVQSNSSTARVRGGFGDQDELDGTPDEEDFTSEESVTTPKKPSNAIVGELPSNASRKRERYGAVKKINHKRSKSGHYAYFYKSNRREITELEKTNALNKAREASAQSINPFFVVMRPSCVYRRFYMTIPSEWKPRCFFKKGQDVTLRVEEKTWLCKISFTRSNIGSQGSGWRNFVRDNYLEEFDVCLFVPSGSKNESYVLDVNIFRVVPEVVPPSSVTPPTAFLPTSATTSAI